MPLAQLSGTEQGRFAGYVLSETGLARGHIAAMVEVSPATVAAWEKRSVEGPNVRDAVRKAVLRFIGMLARSPSELTLQLVTKESLLMVNMMSDEAPAKPLAVSLASAIYWASFSCVLHML